MARKENDDFYSVIIIQEKMIDVVMALYDKKGTYSKYAGVAIASLLENTDEKVRLHILHDSTLSDINRSKMEKLVQDYGQAIVFCDVELSDYIKNLDTVKYFTPGTLFRLKIADLIPNNIDKILYLDADTLVNLDVGSLWDLDMKENATIMAVRDQGYFPPNSKNLFKQGILEEDNYFNAGVLFINLKRLREKHNFYNESLEFLQKYPQSPFPDQDAINYIFKKEVQYLPDEYDTFTVRLRGKRIPLENKIYHYAGDHPYAIPRDSFDEYFYQILKKTPWGDLNTLIDYYQTQLKKKEQQIEQIREMNKFSRKRRVAFWGASGLMLDPIMENFNIDYQKDYLVDNAERLWGQSINGLLVKNPAVLKNDKNVYIVVVSNLHYNEIKRQLESYGKIEGKDFFDGKVLLNESEDGIQMG